MQCNNNTENIHRSLKPHINITLYPRQQTRRGAVRKLRSETDLAVKHAYVEGLSRTTRQFWTIFFIKNNFINDVDVENNIKIIIIQKNILFNNFVLN